MFQSYNDFVLPEIFHYQNKYKKQKNKLLNILYDLRQNYKKIKLFNIFYRIYSHI